VRKEESDREREEGGESRQKRGREVKRHIFVSGADHYDSYAV
jgi:hypothetical protein